MWGGCLSPPQIHTRAVAAARRDKAEGQINSKAQPQKRVRDTQVLSFNTDVSVWHGTGIWPWPASAKKPSMAPQCFGGKSPDSAACV